MPSMQPIVHHLEIDCKRSLLSSASLVALGLSHPVRSPDGIAKALVGCIAVVWRKTVDPSKP